MAPRLRECTNSAHTARGSNEAGFTQPKCHHFIRPTSGRHLSQLGVREPTSVGPVWPRVVGGFMSAEVDALITAYRIYWNKGHSDATIAPQKFDVDKFNKKRKVGTGWPISSRTGFG